MGKVHNQTSFSVTRDNVLNFGILCTKKKKKQLMKKEQCR